MQADEQKVKYHLLVLANISSTVADKERTEPIEADLDDYLQKTYYHPIFFFKQKDGSMTKVTDNDEDPKDINVMKHGIINSIRTYVSEKESREVQGDIMTLVDDTLVQNILQMDVSNTRLIECGKIVYSDSIIQIEYRGVKQGNDDNDAKIVIVGHWVLDKGELVCHQAIEKLNSTIQKNHEIGFIPV
ncbi:MAG: hypothetical protein EZS28_003912 [Streblomastix strix]|uniref:Uncharacterized protein n=1 Tax=Streblomastix strix TaxID=222440 RepID=A0A5J4X043_9EUKA|nr:MAG: hypothetical protein EZS28_003912 [Streblomastix strix]